MYWLVVKGINSDDLKMTSWNVETCSAIYYHNIVVIDWQFILLWLLWSYCDHTQQDGMLEVNNCFSANQDIPHILQKPTVHYRIHKFPPGPRLILWLFHNTIRFHGEQLSTPHTTPKLEDRPLSAVRDCLFNIFAATLHAGGSSSICNLRTCHAVAAGTHLSWRAATTKISKNLGAAAKGQYMHLICKQ
jgi:hypothetical protein